MRYVFADCLLDTQLYTLSRAGRVIPLRPKAFHVLRYLLEHRDHLVSKDELCAHVWPGQFISDATNRGLYQACSPGHWGHRAGATAH
jgi:DNA-binding winged helix-turn-helix (wHTH) protein